MNEMIIPDTPTHFYKYRTINEFTKNCIIDCEIFFASPQNLNDPFDCKAYYSLDFTIEELGVYVAAIVKGTKFAKSDAQRKILFDTMIMEYLDAPRENTKARLDTFWEESLNQSVGVYSMSEKKDNILMWTHYSDNHKGICLEFDADQRPFKKKRGKVIYSEKLPHKRFMNLNPSENSDILLTKSLDWSYEAEWRLIDSPPGKKQYTPNALTGIILGMATSKEHELDIRQWAKQSRSKHKIYRAIRKEKEYGLTIIEA